MPTEALQPGIPTTTVAGRTYALPARIVSISGTGAFETSLDGTTWSGVTPPTNFLAAVFIRSTGAGLLLVRTLD